MTENQGNLFTIEDIWGERDKSVPADPQKTYDPLYFWDNFGENYYKSFGKKEQFQFGLDGNNPVSWLIFKLELLKAENILEAGCGFGRLAPFLIDSNAVKEYNGVDFSVKILKFAEAYLKDYPKDKMDRIKFHHASAKRMPFENKSIDVVLSSELLMHMTYTKVDHCLREFRRIAKKNIILIERFVFDGEHPYPHIWSHDLPKLVGDLGFTTLECKFVGNGMIGMILKV